MPADGWVGVTPVKCQYTNSSLTSEEVKIKPKQYKYNQPQKNHDIGIFFMAQKHASSTHTLSTCIWKDEQHNTHTFSEAI